jgi:ABC-type multidrug transport system fused ATPase/permease subunit
MSGADLSAMSGFAQAAYIEATAAALVIPAVWPIVAIVYEAQSDPGQIWKAADGWREMRDELHKAQQKIEELSRRVGEDKWAGDDRTAFEQRMHDYVNQIDFAMALAWTVEAILYLLAVLITAFIILFFVITTLLAIFAAAICIAAGTVVGAPEAAGMESEATAFAEGCISVLESAGKMLTFTFWGTSGVLSALLGVDMVGQSAKGNKDAFANLAQATLNGADVMLAGTLNYLQQKATGKLLKGEDNKILGKSIPDIPESARFPIQGGEATKGLFDIFGGGATFTTEKSYGTEDSNHNGKSDGNDYVDQTQPHR